MKTTGEMVSVNVLDKIQLSQAQVKSYTIAELNQQTSRVLDEINASGEPALITKHGRMVALIRPLVGMSIESIVLSRDTEFTRSLAADDAGEVGTQAEELAERLGVALHSPPSPEKP